MRTTYHAPKKSSNIQKNTDGDMDSNNQPSAKEGIQHDNVSHQRAAERPNGKNGVKKQIYTTKPAPLQTCSFHVRIGLDPGTCWYLPPWAGNVYHNHKKVRAGQKRKHRVTRSHTGVIYDIMTPPPSSSEEDNDSGTESLFGGAFRQEINLSPSRTALASTSTEELVSVPMVHRNSKFFDTSMSTFKSVLNTFQSCNDPELEDYFNAELSAFIGRCQERVIEKFGKDSNFTGENISLSEDRRRKYQRIQSHGEPSRRKKGERTAARLPVSSLTMSGDNEPCLE